MIIQHIQVASVTGQNGTGKMMAISIDFNSTEMDFHSATTSHKL